MTPLEELALKQAIKPPFETTQEVAPNPIEPETPTDMDSIKLKLVELLEQRQQNLDKMTNRGFCTECSPMQKVMSIVWTTGSIASVVLVFVMIFRLIKPAK